jgi:hypothetical protein
MKLEIQYTEEDHKEAQGEAYGTGAKANKGKSWVGLLGWFVFLMVVSGLWLLMPVQHDAAAESQEPVADLMVTLLPGIVIGMVLLALMIVFMMGALRNSRTGNVFSEEGRERTKRGGRIGAIVFGLLLIVGLLAPQFVPVVEWRPTRYQALMVGFAPWIVVLVAMVPFFNWYVKETRRLMWEQSPGLHRPHVLEVSDEGVVNSDTHGSSTYRWAAFVRFRETENLYILVLENSQFLMVPKRAISDPAMVMGFRAMIQSRIPEGYFLTPTQGAFPVLPPPPLIKV